MNTSKPNKQRRYGRPAAAMSLKTVALSLSLSLLPFAGSFAQVLNPSFESDPMSPIPAPTAAFRPYTNTSSPMLTDWTVISGTIDLHHSSHWAMGCPPGGGDYHIDLNPDGVIRQTVNVVAGTTYSFSFWRSVHAQVNCASVNANVDISGAGGTLYNANFVLSDADKPWQQEATVFTATASGPVDITFSGTGSCYTYGGMLVDLVSMEPIQDPCSDDCFWKLTGNNIAGGRNIFGTITSDDVRIKTANQDRGIFTSKGLLGWNTMAPTAYLHVFCDGNNKEDGRLSDVRFERLERGQGNILVINSAGYVLDSKVPITAITPKALAELKQDIEREKERNDRLEQELLEVKRLLNSTTPVMNAAQSGSHLFQNTPNPFGGETAIPYYIDQLRSGAAIIVSDAAGKEITRYVISQAGKGTVTFKAANLSQGIYFYSLLVDGREIETRRMVVGKQ
ncbi:DUF642 domain-containing protein [Taibaiella koreensis]|uniref:DUF642 domain-containing protein n=1 Tax=Taibaiella koreensis TaxID=1268548 RepID=UPI0013C2E343|nr:DUF642 domain-containing protein [Taibaiella koreensis]